VSRIGSGAQQRKGGKPGEQPAPAEAQAEGDAVGKQQKKQPKKQVALSAEAQSGKAPLNSFSQLAALMAQRGAAPAPPAPAKQEVPPAPPEGDAPPPLQE
ncbi:MAG: hypothetical protein K2W96_10075, partial [Gemmataceae bacterium]|nr:hypothetical protein [Gemmataceae bacterium]